MVACWCLSFEKALLFFWFVLWVQGWPQGHPNAFGFPSHSFWTVRTQRSFSICRNKTGISTVRGSNDLERIEGEYIKNLQQQVYFLELEANYLYPCKKITSVAAQISSRWASLFAVLCPFHHPFFFQTSVLILNSSRDNPVTFSWLLTRREQAKKATDLHPAMTAEAERMLLKLRVCTHSQLAFHIRYPELEFSNFDWHTCPRKVIGKITNLRFLSCDRLCSQKWTACMSR